MKKNLLLKIALIYQSLISTMHPTYATELDHNNREAWHESLFAAGLDKLPGQGDQLNAGIKFENNGSFKVIGIGNELKPQPEAATQVRNLFTRIKVPPLPANVRETPYCWFNFSWKHDGNSASTAYSGPNFESKLPEFVLYDIGAVKRAYTSVIQKRFLQYFLVKDGKIVDGEGAAQVRFSLGPNGEIKKIQISAADKVQEKLVYDCLAQAHPFGPLPKEYASTPNFMMNVRWKIHSENGLRDPVVTHVSK